MRWRLAVATATLVSGCAIPQATPSDDALPMAADSPVNAQVVVHDYAELGRVANVRLSLQRNGGVVSEQLCRDAWRNLRAQPRWVALPVQPATVFLQRCEHG